MFSSTDTALVWCFDLRELGKPAVDALALQPSHFIHRDYIPGRRTRHDRLAGPGVDREVKRRFSRGADGLWSQLK
jgi:hypothetical protein